MVIKSNSGNSAFNAKEIACVSFRMIFLTKRKGFKKIKCPLVGKDGKYVVDKKHINVMLKNGITIDLCAPTNEDGQTMFDALVNGMI